MCSCSWLPVLVTLCVVRSITFLKNDFNLDLGYLILKYLIGSETELFNWRRAELSNWIRI